MQYTLGQKKNQHQLQKKLVRKYQAKNQLQPNKKHALPKPDNM